jgi:L-ascorbate 6-phosphate lactonase
MKTTWLTQGGFLFDTGSIRILVDPYMSDSLEKNGIKRLLPFPVKISELRPDIFISTHDHIDHLDPETVVTITENYPSCRFAGGMNCFQHFLKLGIEKQRCILLQTENPLSVVPTLNIIPVPAFHSDPYAVGLVIQKDSRRIYLSGDTEFDEKLINRYTRNSDALLVCINGRLGNMNSDKALNLARRIQPSVALPMHYGLFAENTADPQPFIRGCRKYGIRSWEMEPGKEFEL